MKTCDIMLFTVPFLIAYHIKTLRSHFAVDILYTDLQGGSFMRSTGEDRIIADRAKVLTAAAHAKILIITGNARIFMNEECEADQQLSWFYLRRLQ